jgi:lysozyme
MNIPALVESLTKHEGLRLSMYTCSAGKPTIGIGHNLERPISERAAKVILDDDIADCIQDMDRAFPGWRAHSDARQNVLLEMCFNMGTVRLRKFKNMWAALEARDYDKAAEEMLLSSWRVQVGQRAHTLAERMRSGL